MNKLNYIRDEGNVSQILTNNFGDSMQKFETIKTAFHFIRVHTRNAAISHTPVRWAVPMELGDELYLWMPMYNKFSKAIVSEFVLPIDFANRPGIMHWIDGTDGTAHDVSMLADYVIKRADGSWVFAKTGKNAKAYAERYNVEAKAA